MSNHVHLLIKELALADTSNLMRNFVSYYSKWFNTKYNRTGSLFKQKFYNECVEGEVQLLNTIRYIHQNPVKACIVESPKLYPWSSYNKYLFSDNKIVDTTFADKFSISKDSILSFTPNPSIEFDDSDLYFKSYDYVFDTICEYLNGDNIFDLMRMETSEQNKLIRYLIIEKNFSKRKIAKIFNFSVSKIKSICA